MVGLGANGVEPRMLLSNGFSGARIDRFGSGNDLWTDDATDIDLPGVDGSSRGTHRVNFWPRVGLEKGEKRG